MLAEKIYRLLCGANAREVIALFRCPPFNDWSKYGSSADPPDPPPPIVRKEDKEETVIFSSDARERVIKCARVFLRFKQEHNDYTTTT